MRNRLLHITVIAALGAIYASTGLCQQITTTNLVMRDGLSSNYVTDITQDKKGFIWFASRYGLNRFDGKHVTTYLKGNNAQSLNSNNIIRVAADTTNNKVWIANRWAGLNVYNCETETFASFLHEAGDSHSLVSNDIRDIAVTPAGNVWIATDKGLDYYDVAQNRFVHYNRSTLPNFPSNNISALAVASDGNLYIGYYNHGFTLFSPASRSVRNFKHSPQEKHSLPNNTVNAIYIDRNNQAWIATNQGLSLFDAQRESFRNSREAQSLHPTMRGRIRTIHQSSDGRIWVGTDSDLCYFQGKDTDDILSGKQDVGHTFIRDIYWGISNPTVHCIFEDRFRNIWVGSNGGGASLIENDDSQFHSWRINKIPGVTNGLNDKEVMTINVAADGAIWMGTDGGGINVNRNGKNDTFYSSSLGNASSYSYFSSLKDSDNNLWFATLESGIDIFLSEEKRFIHYNLQQYSRISCLFEDDRRNVWIGGSSGIEIYNLDTRERRYINHTNSEVPDSEVRALSQDSEGNIWIGSLNKGITLYDMNQNRMTHIDRQALFGNSTVNQIFRDSKDRMWVATSEGLVLFPDKELSHYRQFSTKEGLGCDLVCSIAEDSENNIWVSTNFGISCIMTEGDKILNYDHNDGALFGNYMTNSVGKGPDGTLYFGSINGVCYFNPQELLAYREIPPVVFTEFKLYGKNPHEDANNISLPMVNRQVSLRHDQNIFSVSFNVMDKSLQGKVKYAYKLEGLEERWINIGEESVVTFRNIPYRRYKLCVKARYTNQTWTDEHSTLSITIHPPLWLTWWAKTIYAICSTALAVILILSYKRRLQWRNVLALEKEKVLKQQELNEERLRFYTNITHELRTPLTLILGPLEDLQSDADVQEKHQKKISLIHRSTIRLLNLVNQILEFRKTETQNKKLCICYGDIGEQILETGLKYKELNRNTEVTFEIVMPADRIRQYFDPEVIAIIVDNLLSNAFKYTEKGSITLTLRTTKEEDVEYTEVEVSDTGIGIPAEELPHIFERYYQTNKERNIPGFGIGLALVKNLVELHQGTITVESEPHQGTTFCLRLVAGNSYPDAIHVNPIPKEEMEEEKINKPIVLIVEDEKEIRDYIAEALLGSYDVIVAENGATGFEAAMNNTPDIIVSDIMMPVKDGIELCKCIKGHVATCHIPIILLTAKDSFQDKTEGYNSGADSYITKPFSASLLKSRVKNILDNRKNIATQIASSKSFKHSVMKDSLNKLDNEFIERVITIIEENLTDEKLDIPSVAQELSMSYSSLYRKIKALTGMSTGEFVRKLRVRKAEQLLLSGKYNISEIAHIVGLNSVSYFRECFKEEYGMTPTEYLKQLSGAGAPAS